MIFRSLEKEDIPILLSSSNCGFVDGWTERAYLSAFESGRFFGFFAVDGEKPLGYITLDKGLDDADIEEVFVFPEFRRKGIANLLIERAISFLREQGISKVLLEVRASNAPAIKLYEKNGFNKINERKKYYPDGENAVIYLKEF